MELWTFRPSLGDDIDGNMSVFGGLFLTDGISDSMTFQTCVCVF